MTDSALPPPRRATLLASFGHAAPEQLLAPDASFSSPFADYHGRADVIHLFGLIARVLEQPVVTGAATDGIWTYTSVTGTVAGGNLEAVVRERHDVDGRLLHATLFLRPYRTLRAAMDEMGRLLADEPLPSAR